MRMASESELSVDQTKVKKKSLRSWFKTLPSRKKLRIGVGELQSSSLHQTENERPMNVLQRMKRHFLKRFSSSKSASATKMKMNELYESSDSYQEPKTTKSDNFAEFYKVYLEKKWLLNTEPNELMYKTSVEMLSHVWYWGDISRKDAQRQLTDKPNGSFLVRDSETIDNQFTLSFRIGNHTLHYRLKYFDNFWNFEDLKFDSIVEMIQDIINRSKTENFVCYVRVPNPGQPPFPVLLKYPVSRYIKLPSLQELSKRIIRTHIKDPEQLPCLPLKLREFVKEDTKDLIYIISI